MSVESLRATACFSRASRRPYRPIARALFSSASSRARAALTRMHLPSPTFTRTFSVRVLTSAKGSTMSMHLRQPSPGGCRRMLLLSHDLFEGIFARAGLVTDIEFFDEFPAHYAIAAARQHRWARGDWQLLPWILGHARDASGGRIRAPIPADQPLEDAR